MATAKKQEMPASSNISTTAPEPAKQTFDAAASASEAPPAIPPGLAKQICPLPVGQVLCCIHTGSYFADREYKTGDLVLVLESEVAKLAHCLAPVKSEE